MQPKIFVPLLIVALLVGTLAGYLLWGQRTGQLQSELASTRAQLAEQAARTEERQRQAEAKLKQVEAELERMKKDFQSERELRRKYEALLAKGRK